MKRARRLFERGWPATVLVAAWLGACAAPGCGDVENATGTGGAGGGAAGRGGTSGAAGRGGAAGTSAAGTAGSAAGTGGGAAGSGGGAAGTGGGVAGTGGGAAGTGGGAAGTGGGAAGSGGRGGGTAGTGGGAAGTGGGTGGTGGGAAGTGGGTAGTSGAAGTGGGAAGTGGSTAGSGGGIAGTGGAAGTGGGAAGTGGSTAGTGGGTAGAGGGTAGTGGGPSASELIAAARATPDGVGLTLPITGAIVTHLRPQISNDLPGFTIQAARTGPALLVAVDPATLTPAPVVGDVVGFTIMTMATFGGQRQAAAISSYAKQGTGANVGALVQDLSTAADLVTASDTYESEIADVRGTITGTFIARGTGFEAADVTTAGVTSSPDLEVRIPTVLRDALDATTGCVFSINRTPINRFNTNAQLIAFNTSEIALSGCPAPTVSGAVALSPTTVRITFTRNILASSVNASGAQFTFSNGLAATAAAVSGRTVTVTTGAQVAGTTYTVSVANSVTDTLTTPIGTPSTAMFPAFVARAVVRINELNANIANSCDLIELRVVSGGTVNGYKLQERGGGASELALTFGNLIVRTNDFIVVHTNAGSATCNPGGATQESVTMADQPAAAFPGNFDAAFDWWSADNGLTNTDNVFTLYDDTGAIMDAVFASDDPAGTTAAAATEAQAAVVGAAAQWSPVMSTYLDAVFRMNACDDLNATATTAAGNSIQRLDNTDDNNKADWTTGAGAASTWGALNPGQTAF